MKIQIFIQSFTDIITNSSSELFCVIESDNCKSIHSYLDSIFGWNQESEITPVVDLINKQERIESRYYGDDTEYDDYPDKWVEVEFPYRLADLQTFYKTGIIAILDEKIGKDNYKITFYD